MRSSGHSGATGDNQNQIDGPQLGQTCSLAHWHHAESIHFWEEELHGVL